MRATVASVALCLCGDVMTGRGIDQVLPHPGNPRLCEPHVTSAMTYVELAEAVNGPIPKPVAFTYIWGDALAEFAKADACIVNLETSVANDCDCWPKDIHYKMNPANAPCIMQAGIDCCVLANNHVLDCGYVGLAQTFDALAQTNVAVAGAGLDLASAQAPAIKDIPGKGRIVVFAFGCATSGIPPQWAAGLDKPGINMLPDLSERTAGRIAAQVRASKKARDVVIASIHWGGNWGYEIPAAQRFFAHRLIETAGVDVIHGHSSHHVKAIEVHDGKLVLYGCGDFLTDYEGIAGFERFRGDLVLMYVPTIETSSGRLADLEIVPFQIRRFRLNRALRADAAWLCAILNREGSEFGTSFNLTADEIIELVRS
ncbi:MAG: CapA family protein [Vulcanimicrobiaceae bacterium]